MIISKKMQVTKCISVLLCIIMLVSILSIKQNILKAAIKPSNPRISNTITTWDCIYFGNYHQSNTSAKEKIKWRVLSVDGDDAFVIADQALDCKPYNNEDMRVTWETCTLRKWLNSDFYNTAFSSAEQSAIKTTTVVNEDNIKYNTEGGNRTTDKICLLSQNEVKNEKYGFNCDYTAESQTRQCNATTYAVNNDCLISIDGNCIWWLRSPGRNNYNTSYVQSDGCCYGDGINVDNYVLGVRPALNVNLSSSSWSNAGTVTSNKGKGSGQNLTPSPTIQPTPIPTETETIQTTPALTETEIIQPTPAPTQISNSTITLSSTQNECATGTIKSDSKVIIKKPALVEGLKVKASSKKSLKLSWEKVAAASGYEIQISLKRNFKNRKKIVIKKRTTRSKTIKGLKKKKKYYIRIRAYKKQGNNKIYGVWIKISKKTK